jgi:hypothetical protein
LAIFGGPRRILEVLCRAGSGLETCRRLLDTEREQLLELLANTPDWSVFLEGEEL